MAAEGVATSGASGGRFVPSRVEGMAGAAEVVVYSDRVEVLAEGRWRSFRFEEFAMSQDPPRVQQWKRQLGWQAPPGVVGGMWFSPERYADSYFRFHTTPELRVYMPAEGPTQYPHSDFWRIQQVIREGGYEVLDVSERFPGYGRSVPRPRGVRIAGGVLLGLLLVNVMVHYGFVRTLGGTPQHGKVENGRFYVGSKATTPERRYTEVSPGLWRFLRWYEWLVIACWLLLAPVSFLAFGRDSYPQGDRSYRRVE